MNPLGSAGGRLTEISATECWELLAARPVGRLAWQGPEGVSVLPVNHALDGHTLVLRTAAYSSIARECDGHDVAFEVDDIDDPSRSGWSVLARGRCHVELPGSATAADPDVWPEGTRRLWLRIDVRSVTGRRLLGG